MSIAEKLTTIAENIQGVFDAGKQAEYDAFWDGYQKSGDRLSYTLAFTGEGWRVNTFKPKYDMTNISNANGMFRQSDIAEDLVAILQDLGVSIDFSHSTDVTCLFYISKFTRVGEISCVSAGNLNCTFMAMFNLVTIDKLILKQDGSNDFTSTFDGNSKLENLTIEGTIGKNGFNVQWSPLLTHDSLMSIVNALQDKTADTSGTSWVVTLGATNIAKLTDEEKAIATEKGWTLA